MQSRFGLMLGYLIYEILHLATLGVKPLGAHMRGAIYVVLPSMYSCHLRPSLAHLVPLIKSSYLFSRAFMVFSSFLSVPSCQLNIATVMHYPIKLTFSSIATISSSIHYSPLGIALSPECASLLTKTCDTDALPIQSTKLPLVIDFSIAIVVLPSPPNVLSRLLNLVTVMHYPLNQHSYH